MKQYQNLQEHIDDLEKAASEAMMHDRDQHATLLMQQVDILKNKQRAANQNRSHHDKPE